MFRVVIFLINRSYGSKMEGYSGLKGSVSRTTIDAKIDLGRVGLWYVDAERGIVSRGFAVKINSRKRETCKMRGSRL